MEFFKRIKTNDLKSKGKVKEENFNIFNDNNHDVDIEMEAWQCATCGFTLQSRGLWGTRQSKRSDGMPSAVPP